MAIKLSEIKVEGSKEKLNSEKKNFSNLNLFENKISDKFKEKFYNNLNVLLNSGLTLYAALDILNLELENKSQKKLLTKLIDDIKVGKTLSSSMEDGKHFSTYETASIRIGEESGKLNIVLKELSTYFEKSNKRKRLLLNSLSYPILVVCIAILCVLFMLIFVIPMFEEIFNRFDGELPQITKMVISISDMFVNKFHYLLIGIVLLFFLIRSLLKIEKAKEYYFLFQLKIPFIGEIIKKNELAKITSLLSIMTGSGVHIIKSLELTSESINFLPYKYDLLKVKKNMENGLSMHESMNNKNLYPARLRSLVKIGEEVNQLNFYFSSLNNDFNQDIEQSSVILGTVLEPILLLFLGGVIGTILVAMYLPLFELSSQW